MLGTRINQFVVTEKLAEGGMGAVYLAVHERLAHLRKVVKVLRPECSRDPATRQRFEREAEAVSRLRHNHIIPIDDFGRMCDGELFLMMPYLEGEPLSAHLRRHGRLGEHRALHIIAQVCSALQHMHDAGIVHRDLKPANIFITHSSRNPYEVKLIDFGIAKVAIGGNTPHATGAGLAIGTPAYMAVEQFEDARRVSPRADVFAAGVVTWEMLTGLLPWGLHAASVMYCKQRERRPQRPSQHLMSMQWADVLLQALALDAADRPQSARELAIALASNTPALPPRLPSGAEILADVAPDLVDGVGPDIATIRNAANQDRIQPLRWPRPAHELPTSRANLSLATTLLSPSTCVASTKRAVTRTGVVVLAAISFAVLVGVALRLSTPHSPAVVPMYGVASPADAGLQQDRCDATATESPTFSSPIPYIK